MKKNPVAEFLKWLTYAIVLLGAVAYLAALVYIGVVNRAEGFDPETIPAFVTQTVTGIAAVLATHTGAVFGIAKYLEDPSLLNPLARRKGLSLKGLVRPDRDELPYTIGQMLAVVLYLVSLVIGVVFWALDGEGPFDPSAAAVLRNMGSTLLGVIAGVFAVWLNVEPKK